MQVVMAKKLVVESLEVEGQDQEAAPQHAADEHRECWVVSVPLERRSKSAVA